MPIEQRYSSIPCTISKQEGEAPADPLSPFRQRNFVLTIPISQFFKAHDNQPGQEFRVNRSAAQQELRPSRGRVLLFMLGAIIRADSIMIVSGQWS